MVWEWLAVKGAFFMMAGVDGFLSKIPRGRKWSLMECNVVSFVCTNTPFFCFNKTVALQPEEVGEDCTLRKLYVMKMRGNPSAMQTFVLHA